MAKSDDEVEETGNKKEESGSSDSVVTSEEGANIPPDSTISIKELLALVNQNFSNSAEGQGRAAPRGGYSGEGSRNGS